MLPIPWAASSGSAINVNIARIRHLIDERGLSLCEAHSLIVVAEANEATADWINWERVSEQFLESRSDRRESTLRDLRYRIANIQKTLASKPRPRDGRSLMRAYAAQHFAKCPPGGKGRRAHIGDVGAFLNFAVDRCGAHTCWKPLAGEELRELIGSSQRTASEKLRRPIKPEQLAALLDALERDSRLDLRLAVGLVGLFGLRPAELAELRVDDEGNLKVGGGVKRNRWSMNQSKTERLVLPLDIPGREGEGQQFLQQYAEGGQTLPARILVTIESGDLKSVGEALRKLLERYRPWQELIEETPGITPYSLRHGYAWRAHKAYGRSLSVRDVAALMGHTPAVHLQHYGQWTDEQGLVEAIKKLTQDFF